jgi:hemolysin activation/secretion protein
MTRRFASISKAFQGVALLGVLACHGTGARAQQPPAESPAQAPAQAEKAPNRFPITAIDISGVTKLSAPEIERIVYAFTGPDRSPADVEGARKAIQDAYAAKGLEAVVVEIPQQPRELFAQGIVSIRVSEAPVGEVRVLDAKHHSSRVARAHVPSLVEGQPVDLRALQADIAAANRFPDRTITPSFKPGKEPGTVDVELKVKDEFPLHASVELSNDHSPSTEPLRLTASLRYTNLWEAGHTIAATYIVAPQSRRESEVYSGSYTAPLIGTPWTLLAYGYKSNSNIAALGGSNVLGNGYQVGLRAIYKLPAQKTFQSISFGPDFKNFEQDIFVGGVAAGSAPIRYIPLVAEYTLAGADDKSSYDFTLGVTAGVRAIKRIRCAVIDPALPCVPVDQFRDREVDSNENFVHFNVSANYARVFAGDFVAAFRYSAQLADSHLVTNEQYSIGGMTSVRGYLQSEAVGDDGVSTSVELRSPSFATMFGSFVDELRVYGFVDSGWAHVRRALPEQKSDFGLVSVGGGVRIGLFKYLTGEIAVGVPLRDGPTSKRGDPRASFVAKGAF